MMETFRRLGQRLSDAWLAIKGELSSYEDCTERRSDEDEAVFDVFSDVTRDVTTASPSLRSASQSYRHPPGAIPLAHCRNSDSERIYGSVPDLHFYQYLQGATIRNVIVRVDTGPEAGPEGTLQRLDLTQKELQWVVRSSSVAADRLVDRLLGPEYLESYGVVQGDEEEEED